VGHSGAKILTPKFFENFYTPALRKAIPLQSWTVPEGFRKLMLPDLKTTGA
jgi:hypothetical protein